MAHLRSVVDRRSGNFAVAMVKPPFLSYRRNPEFPSQTTTVSAHPTARTAFDIVSAAFMCVQLEGLGYGGDAARSTTDHSHSRGFKGTSMFWNLG
ncbi:hypothetical protein LTR60_000010 [Cryomyces antarcticus]|nr:hypothetical protein LTR60_000010 [Cryomyces antarcticus]